MDEPATVELLVLREAILWCLRLGYHVICFEGDAKVVIDKINQSNTRDSRMGALLQEVVSYCTLHQGLSVRFVGRSNNRVAHVVAKKGLALYQASCRSFDFMAWLNSRM
ncbi:unnamed protein product [Linum trigynum]|uniref:RNase H type-1 domain-containing protein n=1 Tax=Linum trigynum TaxID=586398 RepID=A0AAV2E5D7_9ROSI